jgi:hypothetical protein
MLLCLSSGARKRYLEDILRATSMPSGTHLRFRYAFRHVFSGLSDELEKNTLVAHEVCIAYFDMADSSREPQVIPCRKAKLLASKRIGDILVLNMELGGFWVARDVSTFNAEIRRLASRIPKWQDGKVEGSFCEKVDAIPKSLMESKELGEWQRLASELSRHTDFNNFHFYYTLQGLFKVGTTTPVPQEEGIYLLDADSSYELSLVQFSPRSDKDDGPALGSILAESEDSNLSFITNKTLAVDSPYDEKFVRFRTNSIFQRVDSLISIFRQSQRGGSDDANKTTGVDKNSRNGSDGAQPTWEFDVLLRISPKLFTLVWQGAFVGALIALQGLVVIWTNDKLADKMTPTLLVVVFGIFTGIAASFKLRRP